MNQKIKYDFIYNGKSNIQKYGERNYAQGLYDEIINLKPKSLLDVGCGDGAFVYWCKQNNIEAYGLDISSKPKFEIIFYQGVATSLPLHDNSVEYITAFDLLEHLSKDDLKIAMNEFKRVSTKGLIASLSYVKASEILGENLHLIIENKEWWTSFLKQYGDLILINKKFDGDKLLNMGIDEKDYCILIWSDDK
jgi:ubiquinone/menaquinone biosynthesis C-methylase UbiE